MTGLDVLLNGPAGPALAIAAMGLASYLCRVSGVVLMGWVSLTPRVERALRALPGSIIVAVAVPAGVAAGPAGIVGLIAAAATMALVRLDLAAILVGVATVAAGRALGF